MRTQQRTVGSHVVEALLDAVERHDERRIVRRAQFGEFAVEVENARRAGAFVQVVDILGDDLHIEIALQSSDGPVCGVRFGREHFAAAVVVEADHAPAVKVQGLGDADLLDLVISPRPI